MLIPVKNEPIVTINGNRWEYCWDTDLKEHVWLHLNCDVAEDHGYCMACGSPTPTEQSMLRR